MKTGTVQENFDHYGGIAPGFDAVRLILAVFVLGWHTLYICLGGPDGPAYAAIAHHPFWLPLVRAILPAYFFLGGFLVTGSAYRLRSVGKFLIYRGLRIVPALLVEVALSAIVLGAMVTALPLDRYFTHPQFFSYFLNILGIVHFQLPGVFSDQPVQAVNANLWTLPPDLHGYAIMALLLATGVILHRRIFTALFGLGTFLFLFFLVFMLYWGVGNDTRVPVMPQLMIFSFLLGAFAYVNADRIVIRPLYAAIAFIGLLCLEIPQTVFPGVIAVCYLTLCAGFADLRKFPLIRRGDYSYGIYLYGFPIQQALWHYFPALREWHWLAVASLPVTLAFAVMSWHFIEEPARRLKKKIPYLKGSKS